MLPIGTGLAIAFATLVLFVSVTSFGIARWQTQNAARELSQLSARAATLLAEDLIRDLIEPIERRLAIDFGLVVAGHVRRDDPSALVERFAPALAQFPHSSSMMIGDQSGRQFLIMSYDELAFASPLLDAVRPELPKPRPTQLFTRDFRPAEWGTRSRWTLLEPGTWRPLQSWEIDLPGYDPKQRPWFARAVAGARGRTPAELAAPGAPGEPGDHYGSWTDAYPLFTSKTPGLSASVAALDPGGELVVVAYDVLLDQISRFTLAQRPTPTAEVFVFDRAGRAIGLPAAARFADPAALRAALFQPLAELDGTLASEVVAAWRGGDAVEAGSPWRLAGRRAPFWASVRHVELAGGDGLWIGVALPERELLGALRRSGDLVVAFGALGLLFAALLSGAMARRFARPLHELAERSERMADLDLAPQPPIRSRIREVMQLSRAMSGMRDSLASDRARRIASEQSLRASEQRFRLVFENAGDPIVLFDLTGRIVGVNRAACAAAGCDRDELVGRSIQHLVPEWPDGFLAELASDVDDREPRTVRSPVRRRDGSSFAAEIRLVGFTADDGSRVLLALARDVSARERAEEELRQTQKMAAIGRLAGGVAHDFNNLLTVILGSSGQLLESLGEEDPRCADVELIVETSTRAAAVSQQLLALSRRQVIEPRRVELADEVPRLARIVVRLLGEDIQLELALDPRTWPVQIDPGQLQQLLVNLATNARDALPAGGRLRIETANRPAAAAGAADEVEIRVADDGTGIPPEVLEHVFEPFFTTKPLGKGTGLGLATSHAIVERAGGRIAVESEAGRGTVISIRLPRTAEATAVEPPTAAPAARPQGGDGTVLLVEDEPAVRTIAEQALVAHGFRVVTAADGVAALDRLAAAEAPFDLLVTDVVMPRMSGSVLARRLRASCPATAVLLISGYADQPDVESLVREGAGFLAKPFSAGELARAAREAITRHAAVEGASSRV